MNKQRLSKIVKYANYFLIGMLLIWLIFSINVLMKTQFSLSFLILIILVALLTACIIGIWSYQKFYYKLAFWTILINIPIKLLAGLGIGVEVLPLVVTIFLMDKLFSKNNSFLSS
ncbi:MAG: hypothetical protein AABY07_04815 [Nanoarchaeota archaeon]